VFVNLGKPAITPPLDPGFLPASVWIRDYNSMIKKSGATVPFRIALQQPNGSTVVQSGELLPDEHPQSELNFMHVERLLKFMLWSGGGSRWFWQGPQSIGERLRQRFSSHPCGSFDSDFMFKVYQEPFSGTITDEVPETRELASPLGRNLEGCRIGFDLGGSDRKVAAVIDGEVVFSEETPWDPYYQNDTEYHRAGIMDSIEKAKTHLPRLDAVGGSSAGVFVDNRPRVASLFRGVSDSDFTEKISSMFIDLGKELEVPLSIINDGEVTALAASMSLEENAVLGIAMGTSEATGYVDTHGRVTSWLNELAFAPVDYSPNAPADEWSGDLGCGVQYFSQQAVGRLIPKTSLSIDSNLGLPEKLERVQEFMENNNEEAADIYRTIGVYLGYAVAHYASFYSIGHVLILGRVTTGKGGAIIQEEASKTLACEFPELKRRINLHQPDEKNKRHGQAIAAASLPAIN
jgi:predicted NBD/HSP70 family sugar kinase